MSASDATSTPYGARAVPTLLAATLLACAAACSPPRGASGVPAELPVLQLSEEPTQQIGRMEGDSDYTFVDIVSTVHAPSGRLFVSDAGISEILEYAPDGTFIRRIGRPGGGPGEFGSLSGIYLGAGDSILALDGRNGRVSIFDPTGHYVRDMEAWRLSGDSLFTGDVWLYGRFWVDGALDSDARTRVRAQLDALPQPTAAPGYRYVRVDARGRLWVREPGLGPGDGRLWTIFDTDGRPAGSLSIPARFEPMEIRDQEITGRWRGESDVNFVRTYTISETGQVRATPSWLTTPTPAPKSSGDQQDFLTAVRSQLKHMASAEEIHYAKAYSYTDQIDSLSAFQPDPNIYVDVVNADTRGWSAVFAHPGLDRLCGLTYGAGGPAGWMSGRVVCGPPSSPADSASRGRR